MAGVPLNHVGVCPADIETSLRFYVEGVGLEVLFDVVLETDLEALLGVATTKVRTVFLGSPSNPDVGALELIDMGNGPIDDQPAGSGTPQRGAFLVSFHLPVRAALDRLAALGLGGPPRVVPTPSGGIAATVVDPDGIVVELLDQPVSLG
jgi:catechol 2,3-dioxygenase-like lactoylglutathione lyase family enzyme